MSTTLTNGLKLPDKGSVDWYADMQNNYTILDGAVGTVAEHTTQIAGKASATHTHGNISNDGKVGTTANKPLITGTGGVVQAGAFGNQANTFCEGNDSRLSDARTPVAHTHTKSDVTDLFNSANVWTDTNTFSNTLKQVNSAITKGTIPQSDTTAFNVYWGGTGVSNLTNGLFVQRGIVYADGSTAYILYALENVSGGTHTSLSLRYNPNDTINPRHAFMRGDFRPYYDNSFNLGIPTHRWKTLNGINPGALSLPDYSSNKVEPINFGQWSVSGGVNDYTPDIDGWLGINIIDAATNSIFVYTKSGIPTNDQAYCASVYGNGSQGLKRLGLMIPVRAGITYGIIIKASSVNDIDFARLYPCLGNV